MSSRITRAGKVVNLEGRTGSNLVFTPEDLKDPDTTAWVLADLLDTVADLTRNRVAQFIDFEDQAVGSAGATLTLPHRFNGRVRWTVVDWTPTAAGNRVALEKDATNTKANYLVLKSYQAGTATIRVEKA